MRKKIWFSLFLVLMLAVGVAYGEVKVPSKGNPPTFTFLAGTDVTKTIAVKSFRLQTEELNISNSFCFEINGTTNVLNAFPIPNGLTAGWLGNDLCFYTYSPIVGLDYNITLLTEY